jgi:hypothetical protein
VLRCSTKTKVDDSGGSVDDPGDSNTDDVGSFSNPATSTTTSPKISASFVSSSLTNRVSLLLSLSDKSTVDVVGNMDMDYATGSFCSPPPMAGGLWCFKLGSGGRWETLGVLEWDELCAPTTTTMGVKEPGASRRLLAV